MGCKLTKYIYSFTVLTVRYFFFMPLYIAYFAGKYLTFYFMAIVDSLISCCFSFVCSCTPEMFSWLIDYLIYNNDNCHFSQMFLNVRIYFKYCWGLYYWFKKNNNKQLWVIVTVLFSDFVNEINQPINRLIVWENNQHINQLILVLNSTSNN